MLRLYGFRFSTNVERVTLALAHKGVSAELVAVDPSDRTAVRQVSGQDLVPVVVDDGGSIVSDSTAILYWLEDRYPDPPLFPSEPVRRAEVGIFLDWFNRVWKRPPNAIVEELEKAAPDSALVERWGREITGALARFDELLDGRAHLMGADFSVADCAAWPFLRLGAGLDPTDPWLFHRVLYDWQEPLRTGRHPRLAEWVERVGRRPRQEF